ncbi:NAD(P)H-binding protein [Novosphingobium lentum]|uniref:NAD(P)H-binding protein n=1 Tax=Novosphingobium lentum TaxID=145287 RepID=UPI000833EFE4|nr:NAD(P)H-binding protein [Novosphingobium lentum]
MSDSLPAGSANALRVVLIGATGMVGRQVMARAVGRDDIRLTAVARREVPLPPGSRMEMLLSDPAHWPDAIAAARASVAVIALGTTIRAVGGDQAAFRAVDHDLVVAAARAAKDAGVRQLIVVTSVGADAGSRNFYLSVKGETEDALARLRFDRLDILHPGLLLGYREGPLRLAERVAMLGSPVLDLLLHGKFRKYRSFKAATLADVILALAGAKAGGRFVHEYDALRRVLRRS